MLRYLVFDLDETIYPRESGLMQVISQRISAYMIERLGMDPQTVPRLRREYWKKYGTTSRGLQLLHNIDLEDYMRYVHDIPLRNYIGPDPELDAVLASLPQRKVIFTNASAGHARAVLEVMGVARHFEGIYDAFFIGNQSKPAIEAYRRLLEALGVSGKACMMIEDSARNLRPAKSLGMITVLVAPKPGEELTGVDYTIERVSEIANVVKTLDTPKSQ